MSRVYGIRICIGAAVVAAITVLLVARSCAERLQSHETPRRAAVHHLVSRIEGLARQMGEYPKEIDGLFHDLGAISRNEFVYLGDCIDGGVPESPAERWGYCPLVLFKARPILEGGRKYWDVVYEGPCFVERLPDEEFRAHVERLREAIEARILPRVKPAYLSRIRGATGY